MCCDYSSPCNPENHPQRRRTRLRVLFFGQTESHNNVALPQSVPVGFADAQTNHAADADASDVHDGPQLNQLDLMKVNSNVDNLEASVQDHHQSLQEHVVQSDPEHPQEPVVEDRFEQHP